MKSAKIQELEDLQKDLKKDVDSLKAFKITKEFGEIIFQNGISNQKVNIKIPVTDNDLYIFQNLKIKLFGNWNYNNYIGSLEKVFAFQCNKKKITVYSEKYNYTENTVANGFSIGTPKIEGNYIIIPISLRSSAGTRPRVVLEGYHFFDVVKTALENVTISEIYTTDTTIFPKAFVTTTEITTGQEFTTGRTVDGKIEYGKRVNFGTLPNNTSKSVAHGIANGFQVTHVDAWATNTNNVFGGIPLPYFVGTKYNELQITSTNIFISNNYDASAFNGYVFIYYLKK